MVEGGSPSLARREQQPEDVSESSPVGAWIERSDSFDSSIRRTRSTNDSPLFHDLGKCTTDQITIRGSAGKSDHVYRVVQGLIPDELAEALVLDFSEYERTEIFHRIDVFQAECDHVRPKALWIFGPPAVGKTTVSSERAGEMFGWPDNAVTVDGSDFRMVHKGFQMVAQHGIRNNLLHADAWKMLKGSGCMDRLKEEIVENAICQRQHLKIPETAVNVKRVNKMLEQQVAAGYELHAVCLWAPKSETEARGRPRGVKEGKAFTTKEYVKASANALSFGKQWMDMLRSDDPNYKSIMFYDNTVFPSRPVHYEEFKHLTELSDAAADKHSQTCKAQRSAHIQSDIAASEARAKGYSRRSVVETALKTWVKAWSTPDDDEMEPTRSRARSMALSDWSLRHPHQVTELISSEHRRGRVEGLFAGILLSVAAIVVKSYIQKNR